MSNQNRQRFFLNYIKQLSDINGIIESEEYPCHCWDCNCDAVFTKIYEVEKWLKEHDVHDTAINFGNIIKKFDIPNAKISRVITADKEYEYAELEEVFIDELISSKIEKLKRLAESTSFEKEAEAAKLKIEKLREKYEDTI